MKKLVLFFTTCIALVAFAGFSTPAFAVISPNCDGDPYSNEPAIHEFFSGTPASHVSYEPSSIEFGGLLCGSDLGLFDGGEGTLVNHLDMDLAPGVEVNDSDSVPVDSFLTAATTSVLIRIGVAMNIPDVAINMVTDEKSECIRERQLILDRGFWTPEGETTGCYRANSYLVQNWNWNTLTEDGKLYTTVGQVYALAGFLPVRLTEVY